VIESIDFGSVRDALREKKITLYGVLSPEQSEIVKNVEDAVRESIGKIDFLFTDILCPQGAKSQEFSEMFVEIYKSFTKGVLRYSKSEQKTLKIEAGDLKALWEEILGIIEFFNEKGITLSKEGLKNVFMYHGLDFWKELFESGCLDDFEDFRWVITRSLSHSVLDPVALLDRLKSFKVDVLADVTLSEFWEMSGLIYYIASTHKPNDALNFLKCVEAQVGEILTDERFRPFVDKIPSNDLYYIVAHNSGRKERAEKLLTEFGEILTEEEFAEFHSRPDIIWGMVNRNSLPARDCLRRINLTIAEILADEEFSGLVESYIVRYIVVEIKCNDPKEYLRQAMREVNKILTEEEFSGFNKVSKTLLYIAVSHGNVRVFLRSVKKKIADELGADTSIDSVGIRRFL
jgi:hypothetical protein